MKFRRFGFEKDEFDRSPVGRCARCGKEYKLNELKIVRATPHTSHYICQKCDWKLRMRKQLHMG